MKPPWRRIVKLATFLNIVAKGKDADNRHLSRYCLSFVIKKCADIGVAQDDVDATNEIPWKNGFGMKRARR
jgi:hypothetical protein